MRAKSTGPKLTSEAKAYLFELLAAGHRNADVLAALLERGFPAVSRQMLTRYRADPRVGIDTSRTCRRQAIPGKVTMENRRSGPRLGLLHKRFIRALIVAGKSNPEILAAMAESGYPQVSTATLCAYRRDPQIVVEMEGALALVVQSGLANRRNRIERIAERLQQFHERLCDDSLDTETFRALSVTELEFLREMERLCYSNLPDGANSDPDPALIAGQERFLLALERVMERAHSQSIAALMADLGAGASPTTTPEQQDVCPALQV